MLDARVPVRGNFDGAACVKCHYFRSGNTVVPGAIMVKPEKHGGGEGGNKFHGSTYLRLPLSVFSLLFCVKWDVDVSLGSSSESARLPETDSSVTILARLGEAFLVSPLRNPKGARWGIVSSETQW